MNKFAIGGIVAGTVLLVGTIGLFTFSSTVSPGNAGIVYNLSGGIEKDKTLGQGFNWVAPWKKVIEYPISTETVYLSKDHKEGKGQDDSFPTVTSEGKQINIDSRYSYHMDVKKLPEIFTKFRGVDHVAIENGWIKTELQKTVRGVTSSYNVFELNGSKNPEINAKVKDALTKTLEPDGIIIEDFSLGAIHPDDNTLKSIQANVDAQLALQKLEMEQKQAEITAQTQRVQAQGNADKSLIEAQGQAKANEVLKQSLTPELVQMQIAKSLPDIKWPSVLGSPGQILNLPQEIIQQPAKK